jgi:drug/metabolite transporter (DMT)-like permease
LVYGLIAAVMWGVSAVAAAKAARRTGTYLAVLCGQGLGLLSLLILAAVIRPSFAAVDGAVAVHLAGAGLVGLLGYLCYYRAVEDGPVGLSSAISATYGGIAALLAVVVLGERLGGLGVAGVVLAVVGVALAIARAGHPGQPAASPAGLTVGLGEPIVGIAPVPRRARRFARAAVPLALASALAYGVGGFLVGDYSGRAGWLGAALIAHGTSVTALLAVLPLMGRRPGAWHGGARGAAWAAVAGLTDAAGLLAFARGGQVGQVAVTAAVSSVFPVIPLAAGLALFGERLRAGQIFGVMLVVTGLVLLGLTT